MSDDELRAPIVAAIEEMNADLLVGRHGDPHVAFTVLIYPDEPPRVIALTDVGARAASDWLTGDEAELLGLTQENGDVEVDPTGRSFIPNELSEAQHALQWAHLALSCADFLKRDHVLLGDWITERIAEGWARTRQYPIDHALALAAHESDNPFVCGGCRQRYHTERGLRMHAQRTHIHRCREAFDRATK